MALQFKLSGYARFLEERINGMLSDDILLWENKVARYNRQNGFEGIFLGLINLLMLLFVYGFGYYSLINTSNIMVCILISIIYYITLVGIIFFIVFYLNEHNKTYKTSLIVSKRIPFEESCKKDKKGFLTVKKIIFILLVVFLIPVAFVPFIYMSIQQNKDININEVSHQYFIVLGHKSNNIPSRDLTERLDLAIELSKSNPNSTFVLSGAGLEANIMYNYLKGKLTSSNIVIKEEKARTTYENLLYSKQLVKDDVCIISSDYHLFRIKILLAGQDLEYEVIGSKTHVLSFFNVLRESYNCLYEIIIGIFR